MRTWGKKLLALILLSTLPFVMAGCGANASAGTASEVPVRVEVASKGKVTTNIEVAGALVPIETVNIGAKMPGEVVSVKAQVGDTVKAGQLLVQLDTEELQAQLEKGEAAVSGAKDQAEQAKLNVEMAKIGLDQAEKTYNRIKTLVDNGAASQNQLDEVKMKLDQARTQYEQSLKQYEIATGSGLTQAEAGLNLLKVQLKNTTIKSPINGIVTNRNIDPGEMAAPGVPLLTVADTSKLKLKGTVAQEVVPLLKVGQEVQVNVDAIPGQMFKGKVTQVGPVSVSTGQRFPVEIIIDNPGILKAGMTARAEFKLTGKEGIIIPGAALKIDNGEDYVFVVEGNTVKRTPVILGLKGEDKVTVYQGLKAGDKVVISNVDLLQDKDKVKIE
ncbi:MAG: hypothetical protein PWP31_1451 [Clostridia bacterium]|nr:hypothetical protein [Clostridia bacterium]